MFHTCKWTCAIVVGSLMMKGFIAISRYSISSVSNDIERGNISSLNNITTNPLQSQLGDRLPACAQWIPINKRKVLFVELQTWSDYYGPSKYKTGEYYASATWEYALRKLGFGVDRVSTKQYYDRMTVDEMMQYYRIFVRDPKPHHHYNISSFFCKVRPMYFFGDWSYKKKENNYRYDVPFSEKQILSANPDNHNTFMGYFPHNLLFSDSNTPHLERGKVGLLYGKKPEYFEGYYDIMQGLLSNGFELHATCKDTIEKNCNLPGDVIRHENLNPNDFAKLMSNFSFMLGFKEPVGSPSPLVGLSYGVAFLNPLRKSQLKYTQHKALARLGFPYTYVVDLENITQVIQAAEWASKYRFLSYVPPQYRVESLVNRMCAMLEDDTFCAV